MSQTTVDERAKLLRRATHASVAVAVTLVFAKLVAWKLTDSAAVLASLVDSALDAAASLVNLLAVRFALKPADEDHRFGHGKSEALAGLAQAASIVASAAFVTIHAIDRLSHPQPLAAVPVGIGVMVFSIVLTFALVRYQRRVIRETGSTAIRADSLHYAGDVATNATTLLALGLSLWGYPQLDPILALVIAASILYGAVRIAWDTFAVLMDHELPVTVQERVRSIALAHAEVVGVHDLRTRQSGPTTLIQIHLEMDGGLSLHDAHRIADEVENALLQAFPGADVVIHQDPVGICEARQFP
jgi:ferrous-iron efflux pump FieF